MEKYQNVKTNIIFKQIIFNRNTSYKNLNCVIVNTFRGQKMKRSYDKRNL